MKKAKPEDMKGRKLRKGDWVRIMCIPDWVKRMPQSTKMVFKDSLNKTFKIEGFDKVGYLELEVWKKLKLKSGDTIWIQPSCVLRSRIGKR